MDAAGGGAGDEVSRQVLGVGHEEGFIRISTGSVCVSESVEMRARLHSVVVDVERRRQNPVQFGLAFCAHSTFLRHGAAIDVILCFISTGENKAIYTSVSLSLHCHGARET